MSASGELDLAGCDELVLADSIVTGATFVTDREMMIEARRTSFDNCDLSRLRFSEMRGCRFNGAKLVGADCAGAVIRDVVFERCIFRYANFRMAQLDRVAFIDCTFDDVDFFDAVLSDVDFSGSSLQSVNVDRMKAVRTDLRGAMQLGLDAVGSLKGCLVKESQLQELVYSLAFATGLGVEARERQ